MTESTTTDTYPFGYECHILDQAGVILPTDREEDCIHLNYFKNSDGSIRWLWPENSTSPEFLAFYNTGNFKASVFAALARLVFLLGLGKYFRQGKLILKNRVYQGGLFNFKAVFTGTPGPNRKAVFKLTHNKEVIFLKYASEKAALENLQKEQDALNYLNRINVSHFFEVPKSIQSARENCFLQTALPLGQASAPKFISDIFPAVYLQWQEENLQFKSPVFMDAAFNTERFDPEFIAVFQRALEFCRQHPLGVSCCVHGDFTPWNCRILDGKLLVFDWEMFNKSGIPLSDFYHFIYQQSILVERSELTEIRNRISEMTEIKCIREFIKNYSLQPVLLEMHYLVNTISYYLGVYSRQEKWHTQVDWLLSTWQQALVYLLSVVTSDTRKDVLSDFHSFSGSLSLAFLKLQVNNLADLPDTSDLDICIHPQDAEKIIEFFKKDGRVSKIVKRNLFKMIQLEIHLNNGSRIDIDLIFKFRRRHLSYLDHREVLRSALLSKEGLWLASPEINQLYIERFYALNGSEIPAKYSSRGSGYHAKEIQKQVNDLPENKGIHKLFNKLAYLTEIIYSMKHERGFLITFSGVDGAGKSTIIENVKSELEKKHRKRVVVLRHRPSILPIISAWKYGKKQAEERSVSNLPRQGKNTGSLSSLLRFFYYLTDYTFGQWIIYFRYVRKGVIVLYDRYYFDFINDSRRSNIALDASFTERFYFLLRKPEFNFFLWAPADIILARKKELDRETIESLTSRYIGLFGRLQKERPDCKYVCIKNLEIGETVDLIMRNITHKPHETDFYTTHSISQS